MFVCRSDILSDIRSDILEKSVSYKNNKIGEYVPYVYLLYFVGIHKFYVGVRFCKGCHPSEFGKRYKSSSKKVRRLWVEYGEPELQIILRGFERSCDAIEYEKKCLIYFDVLNNDNWLNENVGGSVSSNKSREGAIKRNMLYGSPRKNSALQKRLGFLGNWKRYKILRPMRQKLLTYENSS
jgi:hypothetical protein